MASRRSVLGWTTLPYSPPPYSAPAPCPLATDCTAWLTVAPGEAIVNGDFFGVFGCGACSCAFCVGGGGLGAGAPWAGDCCIACCGAAGGVAGLGGPGRRAAINLRKKSLSTAGLFVCAMRFLSDMMSVFCGGVLIFCRSSG